MRRPLLGVLAAPLAALAFTAPAQATSTLSTDYCKASLRGQTGQAPDNDVKRVWDSYETLYHVDIVSSTLGNWRRISNYYLTVNAYYYLRGSAIPWKAAGFRCWWDYPNTSRAEYHDDGGYSPWP